MTHELARPAKDALLQGSVLPPRCGVVAKATQDGLMTAAAVLRGIYSKYGRDRWKGGRVVEQPSAERGLEEIPVRSDVPVRPLESGADSVPEPADDRSLC
ncbi:hypothetical protein [Streptomyces colonosanans]|uniref:hypothetical protein n=1 Tax=Streptomyces colonosanans TaxID=1428652 RepID=UPI00115FB119|nr:hypothetical protein [Streptomyces colonosanans]